MATLATSWSKLTCLISSPGRPASKKRQECPAATLRIPGSLSSDLLVESSHEVMSRSVLTLAIMRWVLKSHHRIVLSSHPVVRMLKSTFHTIDLMLPPCCPAPISSPSEVVLGVTGAEVFVCAGDPALPVLVRSKIFSFLSCAPVATHWGLFCMGNATARTMWLWVRTCKHSPVCGSQIRLFNHQHQICLANARPYAVKSADPVAAILASADNLDDHTAPLCPIKVPIL